MSAQVGEIVFALNEAISRGEQDSVLAGAKAAGYTLEELGQMTGYTREWVRLRIKRVPANAKLPVFPKSPRLVEREAKQRAEREARFNAGRILGVKRSAEVMSVPVATLTEIQRLHALVSECRGWTPMDHPSRQAIKPFGDLLWQTMQDYEIPQLQLERVLGKGRTTFVVWLRNHGYLKQMPSQRSYKGTVIDLRAPKPRVKTMVPGGTCSRGHLLSPDNIEKNGPKYITCKICRAASRKARYHREKKAAVSN